MKQKIYYISLRDIRKINPSAVVMMQTCYQLSQAGYRVVFLVPFIFHRRELKRGDVWEAYNIPRKSFKIVFLPVFFREGIGSRFFKIFSHLFYAFGLLGSTIAREKASIHIISRDIISTYPYLLLLSPVRRWRQITFLYELHVPSMKLPHRFIYRKMDRIYCITDGVRKFLLNNLGIDGGKTTTIRPGFDPSAYANTRDKITLRKELGLPVEGFVVMYTGKVTRQMKEIKLILKAAKALPELLFVLVGGRLVNIQPLMRFCQENGIVNVIFTGLVDPGLVPAYQLSADILLMCYPGDWPIRNSISPTKMMEYMASGNPVISVNFAAICEVLKHKKNAFLIEPDNVSRLIAAINFLKENRSISQAIGARAKKDVEKFSWKNRARKIIDLIESVHA